MLEEYVKDNYSYHCCSEMHFTSRFVVNLDSQWRVQCRSKATDHEKCLKSI